MYAYLIDPFARTVTQVGRIKTQSGENRLREIYTLIDCECITAVGPENAEGDIFYVDDEGQFREDQAWFFCRLFPHQPLAGKALWVGTTDHGNDRDPRSTLDYVRAHVIWLAGNDRGELYPVTADGFPL
ncbi:hypothetical protein QFZ99_000878 [Paraburkholderia atlantica]|uniref:DUF3846 domain-containing protein n=1 Tax=Paraburkholderia atlantica TaxID=2654982 RepID=UPI003D25A42C